MFKGMNPVLKKVSPVAAGAGLLAVVVLAGCGNAQMPFAPGALNAKAGAGANAQVGKPNGGSSPGAVKVSYTRDVLPVFQKNCAMCHGAGRMNPKDWTSYDVAFANKDLILLRVVTQKDMPLGIPLSESERELIGEWIKLGALDAPVETAPAPVPEPQPTATPTPTPEPTATATPVPSPEPVPSPTLILNPTYRGQVRDIFVNRCSMCHGDGKMNPSDWTDYAQAFAKKDLILQRVVVEGTMPMGSPLEDADRELIRRWIDKGAIE